MLGLVLVLIIWGIDFGRSRHTASLQTSSAIPPSCACPRILWAARMVAMFNRVAGGNYTKAADISADILAKLRHDMPEDDSRVPNVMADFIGDNVNDIAGNCSDLLESFVATMAASIMIAVTMFNNNRRYRRGYLQCYLRVPDTVGWLRPAGLRAGPGLCLPAQDGRQSLP